MSPLRRRHRPYDSPVLPSRGRSARLDDDPVSAVGSEVGVSFLGELSEGPLGDRDLLQELDFDKQH